MTLDARRIALQGIGFGALATALQGFVPVEVTDIPVTIISGGPPIRQIYVPRSRARIEEEELMLIVAAALHVIENL